MERPANYLDWAVAGRPLPGQAVSGDNHFVAATDAGWLLAVADGLGHGAGAAEASALLVETLEGNEDEPLTELVRRCHTRLRTTRGCALAVAYVDARHHHVTWIGVGNVEGVILRAAPHPSPTLYITQRSGIVGYRLPELLASTQLLQEGDLLILATDGIREGFADGVLPELPPQGLAERLLGAYAKPDDDALVLVARWCRGPDGDTP